MPTKKIEATEKLIQIQHLLKLNALSEIGSGIWWCDSNTTLVKVKLNKRSREEIFVKIQIQHLLKLNTIFSINARYDVCIQIQHLLKLNYHCFVLFANCSGIQIQHLLKLNLGYFFCIC